MEGVYGKGKWTRRTTAGKEETLDITALARLLASSRNEKELREFRARFNIPISDDELAEAPFYKPAADSPEMRYLLERRKALGGFLPARVVKYQPLKAPGEAFLDRYKAGSGKLTPSTTKVFVDVLAQLLADKDLRRHIVPIIPDEARTFGMDPMFKRYGIYSNVGQVYVPYDAQTLLAYHGRRTA
jgi:pyruvate dehydrogenase E1 component